ncbi:MAG: DUF4157 domain-containing protein [Bacteroidota bacterium]
MRTHANEPNEQLSQSMTSESSPSQSGNDHAFKFIDKRPEAITQRKMQELANPSIQTKQAIQFQTIANSHAQQHQPFPTKKNDTGLPDHLKTGIENLSGISLDDIHVHRNSDKPAQLQAHAYAQGANIYLGPGQERHLPHEAWHVVQQKQGRVKPTMQMKGPVNINDDAKLEREADKMGAKALQRQEPKDSTQLTHQPAPNSAPVQGMFEWVEVYGILGPFAYFAISTLGAGVFFAIVLRCFKTKRNSPKQLREALDERIKSDFGQVESDSQDDDDASTKENDSVKEEKEIEEVKDKIELESSRSKIEDEIPTDVQKVVRESSSTEISIADPIDGPSEEMLAAEEEDQQASSRAATYLNALRNTNMWGGYVEANAIATFLGFTTQIFTNDRGNLRLLANIGNGPQRQLYLLWTGNHYQVIAGNLNDGDPVPAADHDPVGDGNCLFEAMFYIAREGGEHVRELLDNSTRRNNEVQNMRNNAANMLAQGDPAVVNYLGEEMHEARKKKDLSEWKNISSSKEITDQALYEKLLLVTYKKYPPSKYHIIKEKKTSYLARRGGQDKEQNIKIFLRDDSEIQEILRSEKQNKKIRDEFQQWLERDISYEQKSERDDEEQLPADYDQHSFKASDSGDILTFLESKVSSSLNLTNCSQHLDGLEGRTTYDYDNHPVYHYSRGRDQWGQQYSVFYVVLDDNFKYIKIIGIGSHVGKSTASYKLSWGIGDQSWTTNKSFSL